MAFIIIIIVIIIIDGGFGGFGAASPVGRWELEGYNGEYTATIKQDGTFSRAQDGVAYETGTWTQDGKHVDLRCLILNGQPYDETSYWVISGDRMTSGQNALVRV